MSGSVLAPKTLRTRLRAIILATSTVALVLASGAFLTWDYFAVRHAAERRLQGVAEVVGSRVSSPVARNDRRAASEALSTLITSPGIVCAAVFGADGALVARYLRADAGEETVPLKPGPETIQTQDNDFGFFHALISEGRQVGTIYLRSDLDERGLRARLNIVVVGVMVLVLLIVSYSLSARMVSSITAPLAGLSQVVQAVTSRRDYTLRAKNEGPQELALLIDGINDMLSQIQVRDGALTLARNELENRVAERTSELTFVNQELSTEISERKRVESSLRESEERYRQLVEFSPDGILILGEGDRILFVNGAALRMFGARNQNDLIGSPFLDRVAPEFHEAVRARLQQVAAEHRGTAPLEERLIRMDGTPIDGEVQETPFIFHAQPAVQVVIRDISKRKEIERMKDEFVSTVSHELRTPLTSIQGSLGLVANGVTGPLPAAAKPLVDIAFKNCGRLILLINDILDSEKIAAGKMKFVLKEQELQPLLDQAIDANRSYGNQFAVRFELGETVPGARAEIDADRFAQVMTNLLSNAAKFSPKGDVVTVSAYRAPGGRLRVSVRDRGQGIPPEFRDRIFQKFSQADSSDRRQKGGTGLGLSISKAIVEKHGGTLSFTSDVGRGTTFVVDLPEKNPPAPAPASGPRALICDDEPPVADILRTILEREKFSAVVAHSLHEAREALAKGPVDLVTLDFMLPDGNGVEFIREIRKSPALKDVPVLLVSPLAGSAQELGGGALGNVEYFDKPIDLARLAAAARAAVASSPRKLEGART